MHFANQPSKAACRTGIALSTLTVLFMLMDAVMKLAHPSFVVESSAQLGYSASVLPGIGALLLLFVLLYIIPRTSILGAILLTGFLGGAVASNVRIGAPLFNTAFPLIFALVLWGGLWLRDVHLRTLLPLAAGTVRPEPLATPTPAASL